jgi:methyltransferase
LDRSFLDALQHAGCRSVFVGIESMDQKALTGVDKGYPAHALAAGLQNAARAGIGVEATVMIGLPEDTTATIRRTTDAVIGLFQDGRLKLVHYFLCVPWPGTVIGDHPERYGIDIVCRRHAHLITAPSVPVASTKYLNAEDVFALWEEGVARLSEATRQKLMLQALRGAFDG